MNRLACSIAGACLALLSLVAIDASAQKRKSDFGGYDESADFDVGPKRKKSRRQKLKFGFGAGLNLPEVLPFEGYVRINRYFGLRGFVAPEIPFNVRVELPRDTLSRKDVIIDNPEIEIKLKARYGPHYGVEGLFFPFGESLFLAAGASFRRFQLGGSVLSPVIINLTGTPEGDIETRTQVGLAADAETTAILLRFGVGWIWDFSLFGWASYLNLSAIGVASPTAVVNTIHVRGLLDSPGVDNEDVTGALAELKTRKEEELKRQALDEMEGVGDTILPIIGLGLGFYL